MDTHYQIEEVKLSPEEDPDYGIYFEYSIGSYRPNMLNASREWRPAADMFETDSCVLIRVDLAGIETSEIALVLDKDKLVLQGVRREPLDKERKHVLSMEVPYGPFKRIFNLPSPVTADGAKAEYSRGFLTVRLQKREKPLARRTIVIID